MIRKSLNRPVRTAPGAIHHYLGWILEARDQRVNLRCIDATFWVIESAEPDLPPMLTSHGFATESYQAQTLRGQE